MSSRPTWLTVKSLFVDSEQTCLSNVALCICIWRVGWKKLKKKKKTQKKTTKTKHRCFQSCVLPAESGESVHDRPKRSSAVCPCAGGWGAGLGWLRIQPELPVGPICLSFSPLSCRRPRAAKQTFLTRRRQSALVFDACRRASRWSFADWVEARRLRVYAFGSLVCFLFARTASCQRSSKVKVPLSPQIHCVFASFGKLDRKWPISPAFNPSA